MKITTNHFLPLVTLVIILSGWVGLMEWHIGSKSCGADFDTSKICKEGVNVAIPLGVSVAIALDVLVLKAANSKDPS
ncbi:hypothetical protein V2H45_00485 [Tumidithrix elongata RA019]|uniref:Uncharacterized protein n=1 Tax=Tumidithrix elongata BACA0141 TaxID=2716417 RepID=A0AAW9PUU3_9CYAN|nr:hypothetical protein [Tumidithrix elongata RA019]